jgi:hypothetical protein
MLFSKTIAMGSSVSSLGISLCGLDLKAACLVAVLAKAFLSLIYSISFFSLSS